ncbi:sugar ABC transporter substrate-binding protein [Ruminococcus sp.]
MNRNKKKGVFRTVTACTLSAIMLLCSSCGGPPAGVRQGGGKIAVITKQPISFWDDVKLGAEDAGKELGYDIIYSVAEGDNDYATQIESIKNAMKENVDAIVIAPNGRTELNEVLQQAVDKGIKIIAINSDVTSPDANNPLTISLVNSSDFDGGVCAARNIIKSWKAKGKEVSDIGTIGIVGSTAATSDMRMLGFFDTMKRTLGKSSGVEFAELSIMGVIMGTASGAPVQAFMYESDDSAGGDAAAYGGEGGDAAAYGAEGGDAAANAAGGADANAAQEEETELTAAELEVLAKQKEKADADTRIKMGIVNSFVQSEPCSKRKEAKEKALAMIDQYPDLSILYGTNTNMTLGICDAINERGLAGKVFAVGFNTDDEIISNIKNGVLQGTVVQNPYVMGYVGVKFATSAINGDNITSHLNTGVSFVNADNMNNDFIKLILDPTADIS